LSAVSFYIDWSTGVRYKRRWFQVLAVTLFALPGIAVIDFLARDPAAGHYIRDHLAYHRPPSASFDVVVEDRPEAYRAYPRVPPGYPTIRFTGRTDKRGYRNLTDLERYDVVVLGDSFCGGARVPDESLWPARLAERTGRTVYNLGMSGYAPLHYLAALKRYGLKLHPKVVLCLLYEGNDFRSAKADRKQEKPSLSKRFKVYWKQSPIIRGIDELFVHTFGPLRAKAPVKGIEILDWMPLQVPAGPQAKYYAFPPKQLRDLYRYTKDEFAVDRHWLAPRALLKEMHERCRDIGARFVVLFAPSKAHVVLPLAADRLPADHVRAFARLRIKENLPDGKTFLRTLLERLDAKESVVRDWCEKRGIPFLSLTRPLRAAAAAGSQVYFTYDQHWTPAGHAVVAETVERFLQSFEAPATSAAAYPDILTARP
ncbi:MAG: hypothetical protein D6788_09075, partial [Planctomycetota bacterium]